MTGIVSSIKTYNYVLEMYVYVDVRYDEFQKMYKYVFKTQALSVS